MDDAFDDDYALIIPKIDSSCSQSEDHIRFEEFYEIDKDIICQFTEMYDCNATPIWEYDECVVTRPGVLAYGTIKYIKGCFCFVEDNTGTILRLFDLAPNNYKIKVENIERR